ncbi:MAG TPA: SGNH/GDSL hydrolase family protein [Streptosporangiaceae bacterium]|nr:SGNH/GDSL hydrolase family protein [Streptosporangiaceae bacterium]
MRRVLAALALAGSLAAAAVSGCSAPVTTRSSGALHAGPPPSYYLSLGDSLSQGVQPDSPGISTRTRDGYADQLYAALRSRQPGLRLVKLGCPGETTATMIHGGICSYPGGSQLAAAVSFLRAHRGRVPLITIDIGANDPSSCIGAPSAARLASCAVRSIPGAAANLARILARLRQADASGRIIAMNYYLPSLGEWRDGLVGQALARLSELAAAGYNILLTKVYQAFGVRVADVFSAFHTADFGGQANLPEFGTLPRNVAAICQWTWECAAPPRGPNEHPNKTGYAVIARAFLLADAPG